MVQSKPMPINSPPLAAPLETQARAVLADLRAALSRVLAGMDVPIRRPRDLRDALDLHQTLAWKVLRIAQTSDLMADAQYIPGPAGLETFLKAADGRGVDRDVLAEAR